VRPARISSRDWRAFVSFWCWCIVILGVVSGFATGDELREARDAGLPHTWLTDALVASMVMIVSGCFGVIAMARRSAR